VSTVVSDRLASPALVRQLVRDVRQQVAGRGIAPLVIGAKARPSWSDGDLDGDDGTIRVLACSTPLSVREALADFAGTAGASSGTDTLVVLTHLGEADLGDDILGRFVRPYLMYLNSWNTVCDHLGVRQLDPDYGTSELSWMAEALLAVPSAAVPGGLSTLSVDAGLRLLARSAFGADDITLERILVATAHPGFDGRVASADSEVVEHLAGVLGERLGPAGAFVTGAIVTGRGALALPAGLASATVTGDPDSGYAHASIEALTQVRQFGEAALAAYARAAEGAFDSLENEDASNIPELITTANRLVDDWNAPLPGRTAVLPAGFEARLSALARELDEFLDESERADLAAVRHAVSAVRSHRDARLPLTRHRAQRAELAARLAVWLQSPASAANGTASGDNPTFGHVLDGYLTDGAWVDTARRRVEEGDDSPAELAAVLSRISEAAYERRRAGNERFARALATWSEHGTAVDLPDGPVTGVESVLEDVAVPLAASEAALLVVLDGCGVPQFLEFAEQFRLLGFSEIGRAGRRASALAALPTVTNVSRASLLCGTLTTGNADAEQRGFAGNTAVERLPGPTAQLFHQRRDLTTGVGVGLPPHVLGAIGSGGPRLVGAVVNTIDDALSNGVFTREYTIENLGPLQGLLRAAADAGRFVVVTADHGHVLGIGLDGRGSANVSGEGGERWREADRDPDEDEVLLRGPRVLRGGDAGVIAPVQDDLRYSARHGGYHGGATPEECLVPVAVYAPPGVQVPSGWEPIAVAPPAWWDLAAVSTPEVEAPAPTRKRRRPDELDGQAAMFPDPSPVEGQESGATGADGNADQRATSAPDAPWIDALLRSSTYAVQLGAMARAKPDEARVRSALGALHARGGTASFAVIAQSTAMPAARVPGFLSALERLLNVDGYGVVTVDRSAQEVRLDEDLLGTQFLGSGT
jgi:hypothetical protein